MPYIKEERRRFIYSASWEVIWLEDIRNAGELNFAITKLITEYFKSHGNYQGINDIVGALEGAKAEFQRRVVSNYEEKKRVENGDVYETEEKNNTPAGFLPF